jgi:hypothetical protein
MECVDAHARVPTRVPGEDDAPEWVTKDFDQVLTEQDIPWRSQ